MTSEDIRNLLAEKGLKITPQRVVIADYLIHEETHPTADDVYDAVKDRLPACSRATIYNTLNTLSDAGVVCAISTEPGKTRYDANMKPHHHFVDTETGLIHDIPWHQVDQLCQSLGDAYRIQDYQITFYGTHQTEQRQPTPRKQDTQNPKPQKKPKTAKTEMPTSKKPQLENRSKKGTSP